MTIAAAKGAHGSRSDPALVGARKIRANSDQKEWVVAGGRRSIECPRKFRIATRVQRHWKRGENGLILLARIANQRALNEVFNARDFFAPPGSRKPEFRRNQFGATLGGPILQARTFFFTDYQAAGRQLGLYEFPLFQKQSAIQESAPLPEIHRALEENAPADIEQSVAAPGMLCAASMEVSAAELVGGKPVW